MACQYAWRRFVLPNWKSGLTSLGQWQLYDTVCGAVTTGWALILPRVTAEEGLPIGLLWLTTPETPLGPALTITEDQRIGLLLFTGSPYGHQAVHGPVGARIGEELSVCTGLSVAVTGCLMPHGCGWSVVWRRCCRRIGQASVAQG